MPYGNIKVEWSVLLDEFFNECLAEKKREHQRKNDDGGTTVNDSFACTIRCTAWRGVSRRERSA